MGALVMFPSRYRGSTKWSHEYRSPVCSSASAPPHVSECTHSPGGSRPSSRGRRRHLHVHLPTSCRTHSSNTSIRKRPYCAPSTERPVTRCPSVRRAAGPPRRPWHDPVGGGLGDTLDDGDELHELAPQLVAQEAVDLAAALGVGRVHRGQRVPLDAGLSEVPSPPITCANVPRPPLLDPIGVVDLARPSIEMPTRTSLRQKTPPIRRR